MGGNTEHLVLLENTRLRAWRTDQSWIQLITSRHQHLKIINHFFFGLDYVVSSSIDQCRPVPIRVDNPQQTVYQILLCRLAMLFSFFIASLISMSCFSTNQCSVERLIMIIKSSASLHLGTLPYSVLHLVAVLHRTFSNCRLNST